MSDPILHLHSGAYAMLKSATQSFYSKESPLIYIKPDTTQLHLALTPARLVNCHADP